MRDRARTSEGIDIILLHQLGYKLWDQARLTRVQKAYLLEAYFYYQEVLAKARGAGPGDSQMDTAKKRGVWEVTQALKKRFGDR